MHYAKNNFLAGEILSLHANCIWHLLRYFVVSGVTQFCCLVYGSSFKVMIHETHFCSRTNPAF